METQYQIHPDFAQIAKIPAIRTRVGIRFVVRRYQGLFEWESSDDKICVERMEIPCESSPTGKVRTLIYTPKGADQTLPCVLFCHGGAMVFPALPYHYRFARAMAEEVPCKVVMPNYHLAPRYRVPQQTEECYEAFRWLLDSAAELAIDGKRIAVVGDSAGGEVATVVAIMARDRGMPMPCAQMLLYPSTDCRQQTASMKKFTDTPICSSTAVRSYYKLTRNPRYDSDVAYISPMEAESLEGLPSAYVETAEYDCLRDEGILYANRLKHEGCAVELYNTAGTIHAFDMAAESTIVRTAFDRRIRFLKIRFAE